MLVSVLLLLSTGGGLRYQLHPFVLSIWMVTFTKLNHIHKPLREFCIKLGTFYPLKSEK